MLKRALKCGNRLGTRARGRRASAHSKSLLVFIVATVFCVCGREIYLVINVAPHPVLLSSGESGRGRDAAHSSTKKNVSWGQLVFCYNNKLICYGTKYAALYIDIPIMFIDWRCAVLQRPIAFPFYRPPCAKSLVKRP